MSLIFLFAVIGVLILGLVTISAIVQRREYLAAQRRQEASKHRMRASETQDLLDGIRTVSLDGKIKAALMDRVIDSLNTAKSIAPDYPNIDKAIEAAHVDRETVSAQAGTGSYILPETEGELAKLIKQLRRVRKIFTLMYQRGKVDEHDYKHQASDLDTITLKINVETFIKFGRVAQAQAKYGSARQNYERAYNVLLKSGVSSPYAQEKLEMLKGLMADTEVEQHPKIEIPEKTEKQEAIDSIFGAKKKW